MSAAPLPPPTAPTTPTTPTTRPAPRSTPTPTRAAAARPESGPGLRGPVMGLVRAALRRWLPGGSWAPRLRGLQAGQAISLRLRRGQTLHVLDGRIRLTGPARWLGERVLQEVQDLGAGQSWRVEDPGLWALQSLPQPARGADPGECTVLVLPAGARPGEPRDLLGDGAQGGDKPDRPW